MDEQLLEELGYHLAVAEPAERRDLFLALIAEHPEAAADLAELMLELALDESSGPERYEPVSDDDPAVLRAMERFTAALRRQRQADPDPGPTTRPSSLGSTRR